MFFLIFKGKFFFILKVIDIVVLLIVVVIVSWFLKEKEFRFGFVDMIIYLLESLCNGMCVVFLIVDDLLVWFIIKILVDVLIKIDFIFFLKLFNLSVFGIISFLFEGMLMVWFIWDFNVGFRCGEVEIFICILFLEVMNIFFFVGDIKFFINIIMNFVFLFFEILLKKKNEMFYF